MDNNNIYNAPEENNNQPSYQYTQEKVQPQGTSGMAIASMVCGIISILACCWWYVTGILAIVAIVLGIVAINKKTPGKGMAIAGIITGAVGIVAAVLAVLFAAAVLASMGAAGLGM